jgi:NADH:ubiquinone oxidoreductase subunit E
MEMKKIKISICTGTACYVMGASELLLLKETLPENLRDVVEVEGMPCVEQCHGITEKRPPYVEIDGELIEAATLQTIISKIEEKLC